MKQATGRLAPGDTRPGIALGLHGFGRIGRAIVRIAADRRAGSVVAVNEKHADSANLRYLLRYDSVYGRWGHQVAAHPAGWTIDGIPVRVTHLPRFDEVGWGQAGARVVVDASTADIGRADYERVLAEGVSTVVVTRISDAADITLIPGVNEDDYDPARHRIVSAGTCDGMALAAVLGPIDRRYGIAGGSITTLHPALSYQNMLDQPLPPLPKEYAAAYALGRASGTNLIAKETSAVPAVEAVLPDMAGRLHAMSFRVPTQAVSAAAVWLRLHRQADVRELESLFADRPNAIVGYTEDPVVSTDIIGVGQAAVVGGAMTAVMDDGFSLRLTVWYDNEWSYAAHVLRIIGQVAAP
ncbi:hypothetical protein OHR68_00810 [Spirillospora sp. NBC_00431]